MAFIEVSGIFKNYDTTAALCGIDLCIEKGQWVSIMGPSGSGKSTLLHIVGGLESPSQGKVCIDGIDIHFLRQTELARFRRDTIGFAFQQAHMIPYLNAVENIMLAQYFHSMPDQNEAEIALRSVGLEHRMKYYYSQLSGGERQRVCIARALVNSPQILLSDEPTGNLDKTNTKNILDLLKTLHREGKFTIVMVTHDPFVAHQAERIIWLEDGKVVRDEHLVV